jgi:hypothetical protein
MSKGSDSGTEHLSRQVEASLALVERLPSTDPELQALQRWQRARLDGTYADLAGQDTYRDACVFFLDELYGGKDVNQRDRQLERALPVMKRFLPDHLLFAVGEAMRLQWMSLDLDARLAARLQGPLDQPEYAAAYRRLAAWEEREEQIRLIGDLGDLLVETVRKPMIRRLVRWMHRPAVAAGFGRLQQFLMEGLDAFAVMGEKGSYFVQTIVDRERQALEAIQAGEDWPFAPWIGEGPERPDPSTRDA